MAHRLRFFKPEKPGSMDWETPGCMGLLIVLCVTIVISPVPSRRVKYFTTSKENVPVTSPDTVTSLSA